MQISLIPESLEGWNGDVLVVGLLEDKIKEQLKFIEQTFDIRLANPLEERNFTAKSGEVRRIELLLSNPSTLIFIGLGNSEKLLINDLRKAAATGARLSIDKGGVLGINLPWNQFDCETVTKVVCEAARLALFKDYRFRSNPEPRSIPTELQLLGLPESTINLPIEIDPICSGVELARELVGAPPNILTPSKLAQKATEIAKEYRLNASILEKNDCRKKGMGAYLAVSQGSDLEPKFIHLTYRPNGTIKRRLALIGKGLTFDSGGYNLKVGASQIDLMKFDMGGSAAVIGAARAIGEIRPKETEVHFIVAACENMVNGSAVHPGDIVTASNGTTIEINNTDAEGRLTLADALVYASQINPDAIVDLATLTGACVIALGNEIAGLWTENDSLAKDLETAAQEAGEGLWRMPLHTPYKDGLKSLLADMKNTGPRQGGSITAALFLKEFVDDSIPWAHIDIAGPVWAEKERGIDPAGATGYGVRTLVNWICNENISIN